MSRMEIQMLCSKLIKPSSPTPPHLRTLKLSPLDHLFAFTAKPCALYYYAADSLSTDDAERRDRMETSLSETLTLFYPLAGRYNKDTHSVDCNDQGVEYLEAKVDAPLSELLSQRDEMIEQLVRFAGGESTPPVASIQVTRFDCGGLIISVRCYHVVVDGFTAANFVSAWAAASREGVGKVTSPTFGLGSFFPENDLPAMKPRPPPTIYGTDKVVTRRLVFDGAKISSLKAGADDPSFHRRPSRVEVMTALIWRAIIGVREAREGRLRTCIACHVMNLRPKIVPALPPLCAGNLLTRAATKFSPEGRLPELKELVGLLMETSKSIATVSRTDLYWKVINASNELHEALEEEEVDVLGFASWCGLPFYEADFGWGKPVWISRTDSPAEAVNLIDAGGGGGVEAWVSLRKKDMLRFIKHPDILASTSSS